MADCNGGRWGGKRRESLNRFKERGGVRSSPPPIQNLPPNPSVRLSEDHFLHYMNSWIAIPSL